MTAPPGKTDRLEVGLGLQGNKTPAEYATIARLAEQYGFDVLAVFSDLMYQPAIVPLMVAALNSTRLRLGPACLNPFTMHPVEIAGQVAALDLTSQGRAYVGLARGSWLKKLGIEQRRPVRALREAAEIVRLLLAGDAGGYDGEVFSLDAGTRLQFDVARSRVPLLIGTWSPKTAALAGEIADEVKIGGSANPAMVRRMREWIDVGTKRAGRSPADVGIVVGAVTVIAEDGEAARRVARSAVGLYLDVVGRLDPTTDVPDEGMVPDDVLDRFAMAGTPEQVVDQAKRLFEAGAHRVEFGSPHGLTEEEGIRLLGERV
ncbi:MAG: LLM class flavin-dependent oxidoreductase, partial [Candidatus Dormibacteraeota bacterium]|nr:LLM class flavin-dependent oxidoreductase [Candidatus Dormibacteraeota bacterium]